MTVLGAPNGSLAGPLAALRLRCIRVFHELATTFSELEDAHEDADEGRTRLLELAADLEEMFFLIAVVGEFNVGKSTLINALLGEPLLETGITPTTDAIELIRYREKVQRRPEQVAPGLRYWAHPNTGGPGVALVDTPGSGSVFRQHEERARAFLHRSDLVLFVLSAKRAFAETERLYLELARDYGKKVILVLNQSDLLAAAELEQVRRFIARQVEELLGIQPLLFTVSAARSLDGEEEAGLMALRTHLMALLREESPARQKLLAQLDTVAPALARAQADLEKRRQLLGQDQERATEAQRELQASSEGWEEELQRAFGDLETVLTALEARGAAFLERELAFRPLRRLPSATILQERFADEVLGQALLEIREQAEGYIHYLVDQNRADWQQMQKRLRDLMAVLGNSARPAAALYAEQRDDLQAAIRHAEREEEHASGGALVAELRARFKQNVLRFRYSALASLGGMAAVVLAVLTPGPLVGAAAAPLALPVALLGAPLAALGSLYAFWQVRRLRRESLRELREARESLGDAYREALTRLTQQERLRTKQRAEELLRPIFARLVGLIERSETQAERLRDHERVLAEIRQDLLETSKN